VDRDPDELPLTLGQTTLLPASLPNGQLVAKQASTLLDIYLP